MHILGKDTGPYAIAYRASTRRFGCLFDRDGRDWLLTAGAFGYAVGFGNIHA